MTLYLDNKPAVDPYSIREKWLEYGFSLELFDKCNMMEFKFIGGHGVGHMIYTTDQTFTVGSELTLTINKEMGGSETHKVLVTDKIQLRKPGTTQPFLYVIQIADLKVKFAAANVSRHYNVINRRTQRSNAIEIIDPDSTPKTLKEVLEDVSGIPAINYHGPVVTPYDVFIDGMSVLDAIDYLCAAYGLLWTYSYNTSESDYDLYVWDCSASIPSMNISDIRDPQEQFKELCFLYPVLDCCLSLPASFRGEEWNGGGVGKARTVYMPFFPAILTPVTGTLQNPSGILGYSNGLRGYIQLAGKMEGRYIVLEYHHTFSTTTAPFCFSIQFLDKGSGPRTIYRADKYPFLECPVQAPKDNQAKNWIGYLYETYQGIVPGFWVVPSAGLDGKAPTTDQYVVNLYKWNYGALGAQVRVEWDCVNYRWIPLQQEYVCPPSTSPITQRDPPPDPEFTYDITDYIWPE